MRILGKSSGQVMSQLQPKVTEVPTPLPFVETIRKAAAQAIAQQRAMGLSIAIVKDGKIVEVPADQPFPPAQ